MPVTFNRMYPRDFTEEQFGDLDRMITRIEGRCVLRSVIIKFSLDIFRSKGGHYTVDYTAYLRSGHMARITCPEIFDSFELMRDYCIDNATYIANLDYESGIKEEVAYIK
jgi:hypothetical protein